MYSYISQSLIPTFCTYFITHIFYNTHCTILICIKPVMCSFTCLFVLKYIGVWPRLH